VQAFIGKIKPVLSQGRSSRFPFSDDGKMPMPADENQESGGLSLTFAL
jgi:hypothetical protein